MSTAIERIIIRCERLESDNKKLRANKAELVAALEERGVDSETFIRCNLQRLAALDALKDCITVMDEAGRNAALKELTDAELGKLWTVTVDNARAALASAKEAV